ncbi:hypothetical protein KSP39_PZI007302 [Platanthera zijinensis]|uniref:Reverse transcriptase domain-containing protein n=1 Tax=Platanthera zijinensis TaxID=2320716 RepID=A0AAP0G9T4_9ASPA
MCSDLLSRLLARAKWMGSLRGVAVCPRAPPIYNLLFAEYTLIFAQAEKEATLDISTILASFSWVFGLVINLQKSRVVFGRGTPKGVMTYITTILGVDGGERHELYLGVSASLRRS